MSGGESVRVLLVDDHAVVRAGFRQLLEQTPSIRVVAEAASGEEAYRRFAECAPDVTVLHLTIRAGLARGAAKDRRARAARVLVFSMHESAAFARQTLKAGARGYVTKASAAESWSRRCRPWRPARATSVPTSAR